MKKKRVDVPYWKLFHIIRSRTCLIRRDPNPRTVLFVTSNLINNELNIVVMVVWRCAAAGRARARVLTETLHAAMDGLHGSTTKPINLYLSTTSHFFCRATIATIDAVRVAAQNVRAAHLKLCFSSY